MPEIESKFDLAACALPELSGGVRISQGYLEVPSGELRLRRKGERCFLTVKGDGTLSREEFETEIPEWTFNQLWPATDGRRVEKTRYALPHDGLTLEIDLYEGHLEGLRTLEVEFPDEATAARFQLPAWIEGAVNVTSDKRFKNKSLARERPN